MTPTDPYAKTMKGKTGIRRIIKAFGYSIDGFKAAFNSEAAFRQVVYLNTALAGLLIFVPFGIVIKMILLLASALSIIVELFNTGLEAAIDRISDDFHPLSKVAKDVGSAAQLISLSLLTILWIMAIIHYLFISLI
ncbi:MAG: diacylglycerol kinase [Moraxella sp.]|nr:diacylglycerol kinase [Moraxella sp.]